MTWNMEDYERNEGETINHAKIVGAFLENTDYTDWFEQRQESLYPETLARSIETTLMSNHENRREAARLALRQITGLAEEAREEAADALALLEPSDAGVPGHTCPAIDKVQRILRQLVWRMDNPDKQTRQTVRDLVSAGIAHLETVREENKQMRASHAEMTKQLRAAMHTKEVTA